MFQAYLLLATGLTISAVAIYYSVLGLAAIFAAAVIPIYIMGTTLEIAKLVAASWLKTNWHRAPRFIKYYMLSAVMVLMFITSMGIFGFLSKAHSDQAVPIGAVVEKIARIDEGINLEKSNIDGYKKELVQLNEYVDQMMSRTTNASGTNRAIQIRRQQQAERDQIQKNIVVSQNKIASLQEDRVPLAANLRQVEAEVGPIKYIAQFIYGDAIDSSILEKAVTWVIILLVIVFDPLAIAMLLAAQLTFQWIKKEKQDVILQSETITNKVDTVAEDTTLNVQESIISLHPYLNKKFFHFKGLSPIVGKLPETDKVEEIMVEAVNEEITVPVETVNDAIVENPVDNDSQLKKKNYMIKQSGAQVLKTKP